LPPHRTSCGSSRSESAGTKGCGPLQGPEGPVVGSPSLPKRHPADLQGSRASVRLYSGATHLLTTVTNAASYVTLPALSGLRKSISHQSPSARAPRAEISTTCGIAFRASKTWQR
jgi:hypothetical protein